ncbi:MAG: thermonuclease family protein [Candidatus Omnitrophica bacterium]|nr:thermonuclease family protein [Candidatus Omnitrophota bacterium]MCF7893556.1 thermonuclease family protein [Candidatus Omnitrophota bacterium]
MKKFLLILFFFLSACSPTDYSKIKVEKVIDGDTIVLSTGESLRYIGIDTPESRIKKGNQFVYDPQPFAIEATQLNKELVEGKSVRIEFDIDKKDRYGRLLGYCFVGDTFVNEKLTEEGYAVLYTYPPNIRYVDLLVQAQKKARQNNRGIWGVYKTINHKQAGNYINQIRTVRGRVLNTYQSNNCTYLNFGSDYKTDFTVVIFNNTLDYFHNEKINPVSFYKGKMIEVSGRIREYNGPEIIVNSPEEIRIIDQN